MEPAVSADRLRRELADIQSELGELKLETLDNHGKLKTSIKETERREREMGEYEGSVKKLQDWISDTRKLTSAPLSATVAAQMTVDQEQLDQVRVFFCPYPTLNQYSTGGDGFDFAQRGFIHQVSVQIFLVFWHTCLCNLQHGFDIISNIHYS